jgi:hypothetical protein
MMKMKNNKTVLEKATTNFQETLEKDRLRSILMYLPVRDLLKEAKVTDVKKKVYARFGDTRVIRYRLELESEGEKHQITQFQHCDGDEVRMTKWGVGLTTDKYNPDLKGQTFEEAYGLNKMGSEYLAKFFDKVKVEELEQMVKASKS